MSRHHLQLVANKLQAVPGGKFLKIISSTNELNINFLRKDSTIYERAEEVEQGDGFNDPDGFAYAQFLSSVNQTVEIEVLSLLMTSSSVIGDVNATVVGDAAMKYSRISSDKHSFLLCCTRSLIGGVFQEAIIWNPALSGYDLVVENVMLRAPSVAAIKSVLVGHTSSASGFTMGYSAGNIEFTNKYADGSAPAAMQAGYYSGGVSHGADFSRMNTGTYESTSYSFESDPFIIPEGKGLVFQSSFGDELFLTANIREELV